jgi:hypothetical protein
MRPDLTLAAETPFESWARVDPAIAREVAAALAEAPRISRSPMVAAAYDELSSQSDAFLATLTDRDGPYGVRVALTSSARPYDSDAELIQAVRRERVLEVTPAARDAGRRHPVLGCEVGGAYDRFRAVHDLVGHVGLGFGFGRDGEYAAWLSQDRLYRGLARWALATELHGEHSVLWVTGQLAEHKAALLDPDLLRRASRGRVRVPGLALDGLRQAA